MMPPVLVKALPLGLVAAALALFVALHGPDRLSIAALESHRDALVHFAEAHLVAAMAIAFGAYAGAVAVSLPGGLVFSLACGLMFGRVLGTAVAVAAATVGATLIFLAARHLFADLARKRLGAAGERINAGFTRHAFGYLLFLRVVPLFPFFLVNLAPAFTSIRVSTYVWATLVGIIPATFVYANLGQALGQIDSSHGVLPIGTLAALALLALLAIVPAIVHRYRRRQVAAVSTSRAR